MAWSSCGHGFLLGYLLLCLVLFVQYRSVSCQKIFRPCLNEEKLCFGMPADCISSDQGQNGCTVLTRIVSMPNPEEGAQVELFIRSNAVSEDGGGDGYAAFGISTDQLMGDDLFTCCSVYSNGTIVVAEGYNRGKSPEMLSRPVGIYRATTGREDDWFKCSWIQKGRTVYAGTSFDIVRTPYHLLLARGPIRNNQIRYHDEKLASSQPIRLQSIGTVIASSAVPYLIKLHGSLMLIAWMGFVSVSIMIARHYKSSWSNQTVCGVKIWFALHRALMVCAILFMILGMTSVFIHVGGWRANNPHQFLGAMANFLMILQPIGALFRCSPEHPKRETFNWVHWFCGNLAHILALSAIFFSATLQSIKLPAAFLWSTVVFVVTHVIVHLIMQVYSVFSHRKQVDVVAMTMADYQNGEMVVTQSKQERPNDSFKQTMLGLYVRKDTTIKRMPKAVRN
ncbi:putative ferric-chelate reductase 1 homolog [Brevipalpus obovatus]|uniref:putative ferric-chelate reductase 1 homolog n=1 Tax=Brevipalpus obovatus TaxID=246614 RepID=UPI003D9E2404